MKKLAELTTLEGIKVLGRLTTEINKLVTNDNFKEKCRDLAENAGSKTTYEQFSIIANLILNDHPEAIIAILACIQNKTAEEIGKQPVLETINQAKSLIQDKDLLNFFSSFTKKVQKTS